MAPSFYRFRKTRVESISVFKGADSRYEIQDASGSTLFDAHVVGNCLGGTTTFSEPGDAGRVSFRMRPKRRFLNLTYFVEEGESGPPVATIQLFKSRGLKVLGPHGHEVFRVIDPKGTFEKLMQDVLEGACGEYALMVDDDAVGFLTTRERPEEDTSEKKGLLGALLKGLKHALVRDWCIELLDEGKGVEDHRPLIASLLLLIEQTIAHDQST